MFLFHIRVLASEDIQQIVAYYEEKLLYATDRFLENLYIELDVIKENPELFQRKYRHTRVRYIKGFPYGIHYILNEKIIEILAVLHTKLRRFLMEDYMNLKNLKQKKKLEILKCVPLVEKLLNHPN